MPRVFKEQDLPYSFLFAQNLKRRQGPSVDSGQCLRELRAYKSKEDLSERESLGRIRLRPL